MTAKEKLCGRCGHTRPFTQDVCDQCGESAYHIVTADEPWVTLSTCGRLKRIAAFVFWWGIIAFGLLAAMGILVRVISFGIEAWIPTSS